MHFIVADSSMLKRSLFFLQFCLKNVVQVSKFIEWLQEAEEEDSDE